MPIPQDISQPIIFALLGIASADQRSNQPPAPALVISGKATTSVAPTKFYAFTPTVRQRGDRKLVFAIENKPAWASFGKRRGTLYGSPQTSHAGIYPNITITVSDGKNTVRLPPFAILVGTQAVPVAATISPAR
jgi:hypothetical protein